MRKNIALTISTLFLSWNVYAATYTANSQKKSQLTLTSSGTMSTATTEAELCVNPETEVTNVKLWMPGCGKGHGSSPTKLVKTGACVKVTDINFVMAGAWELQVSLANGDSAVFTVDVKEEGEL